MIQQGDILAGKYVIRGALGYGGTATVFRASAPDGNPVAVKVLEPVSDDAFDTAVARLRREATIIATIENPHVVSLLDFGETDSGYPYIVCELLEGDNLARALAIRGPLDEPTVVHIARQILSGLADAHRLNVVHRDVKPDNIVRAPRDDDEWFVKLIDFGIARPDQGEALTKTGVAVGTPRFMAPEQLYGEHPTPAADVFAVGLVMRELLQGTQSVDRAALSAGTAPPLPASTPLVAFIERMSDPDRTKRPQSASAALRALNNLSKHENGAPAREPTVLERPPVFSAQPPRRKYIVLTTAVLVLIGGLWASRVLRTEEPPAPHIENRVRPTGLIEQPERSQSSPASTQDAEELDDADEPEMPASDGETALPDACSTDAVSKVYRERINGREMGWKLFVPRGMGDEPLPVVVLFHGAGRRPSGYTKNGLRDIADELGAVILAPFGSGGLSWETDPGSLTWVSELLDRVGKQVCIDRQRVVALGDSRGGFMVRGLACTDIIQGAIVTSFRPLNEPPRKCTKPMPWLVVTPNDTKHLPADGRPICPFGFDILPLDVFEKRLASQNLCEGEPEARKIGGLDCSVWDCEATVTSCTVDGGLGWKGFKPRELDIMQCDMGTYERSATPAIREFLAAAFAKQ